MWQRKTLFLSLFITCCMLMTISIVHAKLNAKQIKSNIALKAPEMRKCYESALKENPKIQGNLIIQFTIEKTGMVTQVKVTESALRSTDVHACLISKMKTLKFPKLEGAAVTIAYPFSFTPNPAASAKKPKNTAQIIQGNMSQRGQGLTQCYEKELKKNPKLQGKVTVQFTIEKNGKVSKAKIANSTLKSNAVHACLVTRVKNLTFPKPKNKAITIAYPFVFKPAKSKPTKAIK
jgi:TonB family protein